jgi:diguanylate cyclase (GGDEF)-like protein/PAS domain S-box-containing protein
MVAVILFIFFSNLTFNKFFQEYLINQEATHINSVVLSTISYFNEKVIKYQSNANDYGRWDDTFDFVNDPGESYIVNNYQIVTFENLDINFVFIFNNDNAILYKQYCDLNKKELSSFPENFEQDFQKAIQDYQFKKNTCEILKVGNKFYFIATSAITDSSISKPTSGTILLGREISADIIQNIEETTNSKMILYHLDNPGSSDTHYYTTEITENSDFIKINIVIPNNQRENSVIQITLTKTRDLFIEGNKQFSKFFVFYIFIMTLITAIVFLLLGRFISKPFDELIKGVKSIDLSKLELKLKTYGKDEFSFLRDSINNLLTSIALEQCKVRENEEKLYYTLISVGDGVIAVDKDYKINLINPVAQRLTGWSSEEALGIHIDTVFNIINEYSRIQVDSPVKKVFQTENIVQMANHTLLIAKDGSEITIEDTAAPIKDKNGNITGAVLVFKDYSEKIEKQKQIEYLSYHDQLTGLYNRRFLEEEIKRLDTIRNLPISFVYADVNGLKTINDAFGHQQGDKLLQKIADIFKTTFRTDDFIARVGGDEFILLLPKTNLDLAKVIVSRINRKIEQETIMDINISISFGWDTKTEENQTTLEIMKNAEKLMYQKKILDSNSKRSAVIKSILNTQHLKSPLESEHSKRVSCLCEAIGKAYNLSEDDLNELKVAGELHDIGKIATDEAILNKPTSLSIAEWAEIRQHPETGFRLLGTSSEFFNIAEYVFSHHENWDGTGYPKGLKGDSISWKARVIRIADAYDAMTSERPYRIALSVEEAVEEIKNNAGIKFDPNIAVVFVEKVLGM